MLSRAGFFATLRTVDHQAPQSMGFSRQECWSGLLFQLLQRIFPEPASSALAGIFFTTVTSESESHSVVSDSLRNPTDYTVHGILHARILEWVAFPFSRGSSQPRERIHLQCGKPGFNPWLGRSPGEWKGYPLQYSGMENSMDCIVHGVTKSKTWLSNFHFTYILG